jgi:hypothetical protein
MFPCHRSHSWISGGDHFLMKNQFVLAVGIVENDRSLYVRQNWGLCGHWSSTRGSYTSPHICFLVIVTFFNFRWRPFLGQTTVGASLWYYWKWSSMLFSTKIGVVWPLIIDQRLVHLTPRMFPCHKSHSWISGGGISFRYYWKWSFMAIFDKNGGRVAIDHWPEARSPHPIYVLHRSHSWISGGDHFLVKNP